MDGLTARTRCACPLTQLPIRRTVDRPVSMLLLKVHASIGPHTKAVADQARNRPSGAWSDLPQIFSRPSYERPAQGPPENSPLILPGQQEAPRGGHEGLP